MARGGRLPAADAAGAALRRPPPAARDARPRPAFAVLPVLVAAGLVLVLLLATAQQYGYERDELYFRMLPPAWGYVDQPPLTPLIVHGLSALLDQPIAFRAVAALVAAGSVPVVALLAREAGGGRLAQSLAGWGSGFGTFTLVFGHSFLTATIDLVVWPAVLLGAMRAVMRRDGRWWLVAGGVAGLTFANKLLVVLLLIGVAVGLAAVGPRAWLRSRWLWAGVGLVLLLGAPTLVHQVLHGLPQVRMGAAIGRGHDLADRLLVLPFLGVLLNPVAVPVWVAGAVAPFRVPRLRPLRFVPVAFATVTLLTVLSGGQLYYPSGVLVAVFAIGCAAVEGWAAAHRRPVAVLAVTGSVVAAVVALPVVPLRVLGSTPIPGTNRAVADQVGWPELAAAVDRAGRTHPDAVVLASNYGEAGAIARYSGTFADRVVSGHDGLADLPVPVPRATTVLVVGAQLERLRPAFHGCRTVARVRRTAGVLNDEVGAPIAVCAYPAASVRALVERARHLG